MMNPRITEKAAVAGVRGHPLCGFQRCLVVGSSYNGSGHTADAE